MSSSNVVGRFAYKSFRLHLGRFAYTIKVGSLGRVECRVFPERETFLCLLNTFNPAHVRTLAMRT